jgi:hypothetical protein
MKMNYVKIREAVDELERIEQRRDAWWRHAREIIDTCSSIRWVSGDPHLPEKALELFDNHVEHLIKKQRAIIATELKMVEA